MTQSPSLCIHFLGRAVPLLQIIPVVSERLFCEPLKEREVIGLFSQWDWRNIWKWTTDTLCLTNCIPTFTRSCKAIMKESIPSSGAESNVLKQPPCIYENTVRGRDLWWLEQWRMSWVVVRNLEWTRLEEIEWGKGDMSQWTYGTGVLQILMPMNEWMSSVTN